MPKPIDHKAAIITIGNEILLGKTLNTNMAYLGSELAKLGIVREVTGKRRDRLYVYESYLQLLQAGADPL